MSPVKIRPAAEEDLAAINDVYNHYVTRSSCTFQTEPSTMDERRAWFEAHKAPHAVTVSELDGAVVGWASLSAFHTRCAYRFTVEDSVYVRHDLRGQGIGTALLADLIERAKALGHHSIVALIAADQGASLRLHAKSAFKEAAHLKEVGYKFDRWLDVIYMQLILGAAAK